MAIGASSRDRLFPVMLTAIFLACFCIPFIFAGKLGGLFSEIRTEQPDESADELFPSANIINAPYEFIRVSGGEAIDPPNDKDFLFAGWFKLRAQPRPGDTMALFSKIDELSRFKTGYALSIARDKESMRPVVYWRDPNGKGGWWNFPELYIPSRTWFMFALSFYQGRYLGLHYAERKSDGHIETRLAGGYDVGMGVRPLSTVDLLAGAMGNGLFRGKIGPLGVFHVKDLDRDLKDVIKEFTKDPLQIPSRFSRANVMLWTTDGKADQGKNGVKVIIDRAGAHKEK